MRVVLSTFAGSIAQDQPHHQVHPDILHLVWKDRNTRLRDKETVPNWCHWQLHLLIREDEAGGKGVFIQNQKSELDVGRADIPDEDFLFNLDDSNCLKLGKDFLKVVILFPKNDKRSKSGDLSISQIIERRVIDKDARKEILERFTGKNSSNLKRVQLKVEVFDLITDELLCSNTSTTIVDMYMSLRIEYVKPSSCCERGGRGHSQMQRGFVFFTIQTPCLTHVIVHKVHILI